MTRSPANDGLCELSHELSRVASSLLSAREQSARRVGANEETITGLLTWMTWQAENRLGLPVSAHEQTKAEESTNGADLEIWFVRGNRGFCWRVQAKRLHAPRPRTPPRFHDLDHPHHTATQIDNLINSAQSSSPYRRYPMYWFYVYDVQHCERCARNTPDPKCHPAGSPAEGVLVAPATKVQPLLKGLKARGKLSYKEARAISSTLPDLFCTTGSTDWNDVWKNLRQSTGSLFDGATGFRPADGPLPLYVADLSLGNEVEGSDLGARRVLTIGEYSP